MNELFRKLAVWTAHITGTPPAFILAFGIVIVWAASGPAFGFSDTWQLVINTGTTIVTFLMVFMIQNTQNRDSRAIHTKLDDLIVFTAAAENEAVDSEELSDEQLERLYQRYRDLAKRLGKPVDGNS